MKRIMAGVLCVVMLLSWTVSAQTFSEEPIDNSPLEAVPTAAEGEILELSAKSAILVEQCTGQVLYESASDERCAPASITKIMSLILIFEAMEAGHFNEDTVLTCSDSAAAMGGSQIWLEPGEQMSVRDLLKAVTIVSANDATVLLCEAVAGSEESFAVMMNEKAAALGMNNTHFVNSTGLDAENHYTTAHDVALMACELLRHEKISEYSTVWMDTLRGGDSQLVNTNKLVRFYEGCTGLKTGTTATAGYCLAASAKRNNLSLVAVVMDAKTSPDRFASAQKLLNYGFAHYTYVTVTPEIPEGQTVPVKKGLTECVPVKAADSFSVLLKKSEVGAITQSMGLIDEVTAPAKAGTAVGSVRFFLKDREIGQVDVVTEQDVECLDFARAVKLIFSMLVAL